MHVIKTYAAHRHSQLQEAAAAADPSRAAVQVESSDTMRSRKARCQAPPDNLETGDAFHSRERSWRENTAPKRIQAAQQQCEHVCTQARPISTNPASMEEACEYGLTRGTFRRTPSRGGRSRRAAVDFVVCFECGGISFFFVFFRSNAHGLLQA